MNSEIDPEIIATIKSAQALSRFAHYIKSLDNTLTLADATVIAAAVIDGLPHLLEANPDLLDVALDCNCRSNKQAMNHDEQTKNRSRTNRHD